MSREKLVVKMFRSEELDYTAFERCFEISEREEFQRNKLKQQDFAFDVEDFMSEQLKNAAETLGLEWNEKFSKRSLRVAIRAVEIYQRTQKAEKVLGKLRGTKEQP